MMGTGGRVPAWVAEIEIMERTGWTEKQLYEDVSLETILKMNYLNEIRAEADKVRRTQGASAASRGDAVKEIEFIVPPGGVVVEGR